MTDQNKEALRLAEFFDNFVEPESLGTAADHLRRLVAENTELQKYCENYRTVMIAAAEEIHEHWSAHCDADGYGPVNLMHRLERGIPAEYGYKAGDFEKLMTENTALREAIVDVYEILGPVAPECCGCKAEWTEALTKLKESCK